MGVVLFHLFGDGRVSGGIDVFLAISGFLFTGMLLREAAEHGHIRITRYLGRLARRILAPAALVIAATTAAGLLILPTTRHDQLVAEARASLLYVENVELIRSQLSYEAAGPETSPFQHFWSLSVQGQFYLVWPALVLLAVWLARRTGRSAAATMSLLVATVFLGSFLWALHHQGINQAEAYLMSGTRAWELAFGSLLALLGAHLRLPQPLRTPAAWTGLGLVVSCGFVLDGAALFPGPWALWPLLGLALLMAAASAPSRTADRSPVAPPPIRFLATRPLARLGDLAYGLYLWHWPALIIHLELTGAEGLDAGGAVVVLVFSLAAAWATHRWVETPLAKWGAPTGTSGTIDAGRERRLHRTTLSLAAGTLALGAAAGTVHLQLTTTPQEGGWATEGLDRQVYPGATVSASSPPGHSADDDVAPFPDLVGMSRRVPEYATRDCHQRTGDDPGTSEVLLCEDPREPHDARLSIMLAGGSHAGHWQHAWLMLAEEHDWEILVATKGGCVFRHIEDREHNQCGAWNADFAAMLDQRQPDVVVTPGTRIPRDGGEESIVDGAQDRWQEITDAGAQLLLVRGTPRQLTNVPDCLASGGDAHSCAPEVDRFAETDPLEDAELPAGTATVDLTDVVCPQGRCSAVIGNVVVYRDSHHLTNEYVETAAPLLEEKLRETMPQLFDSGDTGAEEPPAEGAADRMTGAQRGDQSR